MVFEYYKLVFEFRGGMEKEWDMRLVETAVSI